jgi:hypothetical protein
MALVEVAAADYWSCLPSQQAPQDTAVEVEAVANALRALASETGVGFISFVRHLGRFILGLT